MRLTALVSGALLSLAAGAAMACPAADRCGGRYGASAYEEYGGDYAPPAYEDDYGYDDRGYDDGYAGDRYGDRGYPAPATWSDERGLYIRGHRGEPCGCLPPPPCGCRAEGLTLSSGFFDGAGGVGPIPNGDYYGGGYYYVLGGRSSAYSHAYASSRASASARVSYRRGWDHRGH